jgi:predicted alpha-1,6-mannanase (GH76 family)
LGTVATVSSATGLNVSRWQAVYESAYANTPVIVDNCFDDHQWWMLAWVSVYRATFNVTYLQRAVQVFDYIATNGWLDQPCGGGVEWCPTTGNQKPYKNSVTTELFMDAAMGLQPYTELLGKPDTYFSDWAATATSWMLSSGLINSAGLANDGLTDQCTNNGQTTWTYK